MALYVVLIDSAMFNHSGEGMRAGFQFEKYAVFKRVESDGISLKIKIFLKK